MTNQMETVYPFFARINPERQSQLSYWSAELAVSETELKKLISVAGPTVKDIQDFLQASQPLPHRL